MKQKSLIAWALALAATLVGTVLPSQIATARSITPSNISTTAVSDWQNTNIIAIDAGLEGACAIQAANPSDTSGVLYCWGKSAILGTGTNLESNVPVKVSTGAGFTNTAVTAVAVGGEHACAIEAGQLWCWGSSYLNGMFGVLGTGASSSLTPVKVSANQGFDNDGASGDSVTAVDVSYAQSCAIEGTEIYCWGNNNSNQLGLGAGGTTGATNIPRRVVDTAATDFYTSTPTALSVGFNFSCALAGTSVFCWGVNAFGELGNTTPASGTPTKVSQGDFTTSNSSVTHLGVGYNHSCAIQGGKVRCWGRGTDHRLGTGTTADEAAPKNVVPASGLFDNTSVTQVSAGEKHTCAIESGKLYCWGNNSSGELGDGSTTSSSSPVLVSTSDVPGFSNNGNVTAVSAASGGGYGHTCAIDNKIAFCWGASMGSRLGAGLVYGNQTKPVKVFVPSAPAAPASPSVMAGSGQLTVSFTKPSDGGSAITSYEYTLDNGATTTSFTSNMNYVSTVISNLTNGTQYSIKVRAINAIGNGAWSTAVTGTPSASAGGGGSGGGGAGGGGVVPAFTSADITKKANRVLLISVTGLQSGARISARAYPTGWTPQTTPGTSYMASFGTTGSSTYELRSMLKLASGAPVPESFAIGTDYTVEIAQNMSGPTSTPIVKTFTFTGNEGAEASSADPGVTTTTTATVTSTPSSVATNAPSTTSTVPGGFFANAVPGVTKTDTTVYTKPPTNVAADSAINVLTRAQNRVMDIQTKTPSVCLPNDDELVFIDEGRCIAEVVNTKTRAVLRTLRTTVVEDEVSELKIGNEIVTLAPIYFDVMSSTLDDKAMSRVKSLKSRVSAAGSVLLVGHSGTLNGNSPENVAISKARAESTLKALKSIGAKGPFAVSGVGALDPAKTAKTEAAQAKNRRVIIVLIP